MKACYYPIWYFLLFLMTTSYLQAQKAETIYPLTEVLYSVEYYKEQAQLWRTILDENPQHAMGWLNYYAASRNERLLSGEDMKSLDRIVEEANKAIPDTYESHFVTFWQDPLGERNFDHIFRAHELAPDRTEIMDDLLMYYELKGDQKNLKKYCQQWYDSGTVSAGVLKWNYNALMSVSDECIFLVESDNATFPAWILQQVHGVKPNVTVLNPYLVVSNDDYRKRIFDKLHIPLEWQAPVSDGYYAQVKSLTQHIIKHAHIPVYFNVSVGPDLRKQFEEELFLVGLAFLHSKTSVDNLAILRNNYENRFLKDDLLNPIGYDPSYTVVDHINWNYLPALTLLHEHYLSSGETAQARKVKKLAVNLAHRAGRESAIANFFPPQFPRIQSPVNINIKSLEKAMKPVGNGRYASATEVSNAEYELFLVSLLKEKEYRLINEFKATPVDWISLIPEEYRNQPSEVLFSNGHPNDPQAPVVNITYEAALAYCDWLTQVYNKSDYKRKQFGQVRFYLPSQEEWRMAAVANGNGPYPWGGPETKNKKGCYLANVNPYLSEYDESKAAFVAVEHPESPGEDGAYFTVPVTSYFPNGLGLYNMTGNVAEMLDGGISAMGGSWLSPAQMAKVNKPQKINLPSPEVGFRVFMEVVKP